MTYSNPLNDRPPCHLLSWGITWKGEPRHRQSYVSITVWVPPEVAAEESAHGQFRHLGGLADYIEANLGFVVARTTGWSHSYSTDATLHQVSVPVRAREVRAALAAR